jgi:hypothetical protein
MSAASKSGPAKKSFSGLMREADLISSWGRPMNSEEETGKCTLGSRRGKGPGILGRIRRNIVGIAFGKAWKRGN